MDIFRNILTTEQSVVVVRSFINYHILQVNVIGKGAGSVTSDISGIDCPGVCEREFLDGTIVTLTVTPEATSSFVGWSGDCTGKQMSCPVTMDQVRNITANIYSFPWDLFVPVITKNGQQ
jgi:hypothetical protein